MHGKLAVASPFRIPLAEAFAENLRPTGEVANAIPSARVARQHVDQVRVMEDISVEAWKNVGRSACTESVDCVRTEDTRAARVRFDGHEVSVTLERSKGLLEPIQRLHSCRRWLREQPSTAV